MSQLVGPTKRATINENTLNRNVVVTGIANKRIIVTHYLVMPSNNVTIQWQDGAGANLSGPMALTANNGGEANNTEEGLFECGVGEDLVLDLSNAIQVGGHLNYRLA